MKYAVCLFSLLIVVGPPDTKAQSPQSEQFQIKWSVVDAGGAATSSANYFLEGSVGQSALARSQSPSYTINAGFFAAPDSDDDWVRDFMDNCLFDPNQNQLDSDGDTYGNRCDADLDNSGVANFVDYVILTNAFLADSSAPNWNPDADFNGDGIINFIDIAQFQFFFLQAPGPSGITQ
ncbi:MAG: dockerin type I domain-containing protein [Pseudomonadota bacterium]